MTPRTLAEHVLSTLGKHVIHTIMTPSTLAKHVLSTI